MKPSFPRLLNDLEDVLLAARKASARAEVETLTPLQISSRLGLFVPLRFQWQDGLCWVALIFFNAKRQRAGDREGADSFTFSFIGIDGWRRLVAIEPEKINVFGFPESDQSFLTGGIELRDRMLAIKGDKAVVFVFVPPNLARLSQIEG